MLVRIVSGISDALAEQGFEVVVAADGRLWVYLGVDRLGTLPDQVSVYDGPAPHGFTARVTLGPDGSAELVLPVPHRDAREAAVAALAEVLGAGRDVLALELRPAPGG